MSKGWIQIAAASIKKRGTEGALTAEAKRHGLSAMAFARYIKAHPENFSRTWKMRANFAINANK